MAFLLRITSVLSLIVIFNINVISASQLEVSEKEYIVHIKIGASVPNLQSSIRSSYEPDSLPTNQSDPGISVNSTVTWINEDESFHTVTSGDIIKGPSLTKPFDSGIIPPKFNWSMTFSKPDNYTYYCTIHPYMDGSVRVKALSPN